MLFGHSWGTILGTVYLKAHPQQVAGYIGMGQVISMRQGEKIGYDRLGQLVTAKNNAKDLAVYTSFQGYPNYLTQDNFIKEIIRFRMFQRKYLQNDSTGIFKLILLMMKSPVFKLTDLRQSADPMETNKYLLASLLDYDITAGYDYAVPIFYICGRNDWQVPSVLAQKYFNLIQAPLKKLYWIEQAGHLTNIDNPAACAQAIEDILRNLTQLNL
ncbi:hypothetical protein SDC9_110806 [bioreactor metagenome]|uniref:AB hydrolase-1 domain-containing protein n=1 Tax=bioreactor metagenome TaxID=1076179 RepID=A0A645BH92_9ZZZZ